MGYTDTSNIENRIGTLTDAQRAYFEDVVSGAVDAYIDKQTGTTFGQTEETDVYESSDGGSMVIIPTMHSITAVATVDEDDTEESIPDYTKYPRGKVETYALRSTSGDWSEGFENIKVTGVLGYKDIPTDIVLVADELATKALSAAGERIVKSEKVGDWQAVYDDLDKNISSESISTLASYRRLSRSI